MSPGLKFQNRNTGTARSPMQGAVDSVQTAPVTPRINLQRHETEFGEDERHDGRVALIQVPPLALRLKLVSEGLDIASKAFAGNVNLGKDLGDAIEVLRRPHVSVSEMQGAIEAWTGWWSTHYESSRVLRALGKSRVARTGGGAELVVAIGVAMAAMGAELISSYVFLALVLTGVGMGVAAIGYRAIQIDTADEHQREPYISLLAQHRYVLWDVLMVQAGEFNEHAPIASKDLGRAVKWSRLRYALRSGTVPTRLLSLIILWETCSRVSRPRQHDYEGRSGGLCVPSVPPLTKGGWAGATFASDHGQESLTRMHEESPSSTAPNGPSETSSPSPGDNESALAADSPPSGGSDATRITSGTFRSVHPAGRSGERFAVRSRVGKLELGKRMKSALRAVSLAALTTIPPVSKDSKPVVVPRAPEASSLSTIALEGDSSSVVARSGGLLNPAVQSVATKNGTTNTGDHPLPPRPLARSSTMETVLVTPRDQYAGISGLSPRLPGASSARLSPTPKTPPRYHPPASVLATPVGASPALRLTPRSSTAARLAAQDEGESVPSALTRSLSDSSWMSSVSASSTTAVSGGFGSPRSVATKLIWPPSEDDKENVQPVANGQQLPTVGDEVRVAKAWAPGEWTWVSAAEQGWEPDLHLVEADEEKAAISAALERKDLHLTAGDPMCSALFLSVSKDDQITVTKVSGAWAHVKTSSNPERAGWVPANIVS